MKMNSAFWMILLAAILLGLPAAAAANSCGDLASLALPDTRITLARSVVAGSFTLPDAVQNSNGGNRMPVFDTRDVATEQSRLLLNVAL